jgi:hypothetical protein
MAPSDVEAVQACSHFQNSNLVRRGGLSGLRFAQCVDRDLSHDGLWPTRLPQAHQPRNAWTSRPSVGRSLIIACQPDQFLAKLSAEHAGQSLSSTESVGGRQRPFRAFAA